MKNTYIGATARDIFSLYFEQIDLGVISQNNSNINVTAQVAIPIP